MTRSKSFNFKLLSYNIHQGISVRRHKLSLSLLKQAISGLDADVVVLQEVAHYVSKEVEKECPLFLAGDFNDWRRQVSRTLSTTLAMKEVFKHQNGKYAETFPSKLPFLNLDRIYFRGSTLQGVTSPKGKPWTRLSDHLPVLAKFVIP